MNYTYKNLEYRRHEHPQFSFSPSQHLRRPVLCERRTFLRNVSCEVREYPHPALASQRGLCSDSEHESQALPLVGARGGKVNLLVTVQTSTPSNPFSTAHHFLAKPGFSGSAYVF